MGYFKKQKKEYGIPIPPIWGLTNDAITLSLAPGGLPYESDGDARRKIRIKPLKETNLGVAQALFDPKGDLAKTDNQIKARAIFNCA